MNFAKKMSLLLTLSASMACSAAALDAQAKFTLPQPARIGSSTLPAGEYLVKTYGAGANAAYIVPADGSGAAVIALPVSTDSYAVCKASSLTMQAVGSAWNISSICFAEMQTALYFTVPTEKKALSAASDSPAIAAAK